MFKSVGQALGQLILQVGVELARKSWPPNRKHTAPRSSTHDDFWLRKTTPAKNQIISAVSIQTTRSKARFHLLKELLCFSLIPHPSGRSSELLLNRANFVCRSRRLYRSGTWHRAQRNLHGWRTDTGSTSALKNCGHKANWRVKRDEVQKIQIPPNPLLYHHVSSKILPQLGGIPVHTQSSDTVPYSYSCPVF